MPTPSESATAGSTPAAFKAARAALVDRADLTGPAFCRAYSGLADDWLASLADQAGITDGSGVALIAVGGYGRRELCPGSDLDVTIVHKAKRLADGVADAVWYPVWDTGVGLDHSVRPVRQALALAEEDLRVVLGLLDGRLVAGDREVAAELFEGVSSRWRRNASRFLPELHRSTVERHARAGEVAFLLEPDLKEGEGGLRDVAILSAAAAAAPVVEDPMRDLSVAAAHATLLAVRVQLHRQTGRSSDRLLLQEQDRAADALGRADADALMAEVAAAGRAVAWAADDGWRRVQAWLEGPRRRAHPDRPLGAGIVLRDGEVALAPDADPSADPVLALRAAAAAASTGLPLARSCLERLSVGGAELPAPWPEEARQELVALLAAGHAAVPLLEALDQTGALVRVLPEWEPVRSRPQRNAYHRFTVDRHLFEAAANAAGLVRSVRRPDLLLIGALLHDIGKGYPGDHTEAGEDVVARVGARMGLAQHDTDTLVAMVRHHLLLPDAATRRDLDDPATAAAVADGVGDLEVLELLAALAEADGRATGPAAWNQWKAGLVRQLVDRAADRLRGLPVRPPVPVITDEHRRLMADRRLRVVAEESSVTVVAPDRPGLLSLAAGVLALHGLAIRSAAAASEDSMAVEVFGVAPDDAGTSNPAGLADDLSAALAGTLDLESALSAREAAYATGRRPRAAIVAEPRVLVDNDASASSTVVEVRAPDAVGLLHRVTAVLASLDLDVVSAKVNTLGHEAVDAFYVRRPDGTKVVDDADIAELCARLEGRLAAAGGRR